MMLRSALVQLFDFCARYCRSIIAAHALGCRRYIRRRAFFDHQGHRDDDIPRPGGLYLH